MHRTQRSATGAVNQTRHEISLWCLHMSMIVPTPALLSTLAIVGETQGGWPHCRLETKIRKRGIRLAEKKRRRALERASNPSSRLQRQTSRSANEIAVGPRALLEALYSTTLAMRAPSSDDIPRDESGSTSVTKTGKITPDGTQCIGLSVRSNQSDS